MLVGLRTVHIRFQEIHTNIVKIVISSNHRGGARDLTLANYQGNPRKVFTFSVISSFLCPTNLLHKTSHSEHYMHACVNSNSKPVPCPPGLHRMLPDPSEETYIFKLY